MLQALESAANELLVSTSRLSLGRDITLTKGKDSLQDILKLLKELLNKQVVDGNTAPMGGWQGGSGVSALTFEVLLEVVVSCFHESDDKAPIPQEAKGVRNLLVRTLGESERPDIIKGRFSFWQ